MRCAPRPVRVAYLEMLYDACSLRVWDVELSPDGATLAVEAERQELSSLLGIAGHSLKRPTGALAFHQERQRRFTAIGEALCATAAKHWRSFRPLYPRQVDLCRVLLLHGVPGDLGLWLRGFTEAEPSRLLVVAVPREMVDFALAWLTQDEDRPDWLPHETTALYGDREWQSDARGRTDRLVAELALAVQQRIPVNASSNSCKRIAAFSLTDNG